MLELLARAHAPTVPHEATLELVTPTGAAILTTLARFAQPRLRLAHIGYGAGGREQPEPTQLPMLLEDEGIPIVERHGFDPAHAEQRVADG